MVPSKPGIRILRPQFPRHDLSLGVLLRHAFLDVFASVRVVPTEKDLQIALLRQQLRILERQSKTKPRLSRPEKLMLVTLATRLKAQTQRFHEALGEAILLIQPATLLKWHHQLARGK